MQFTGERYVPGTPGQIKLEHLQRYALCRQLALGKRVLDIACGEGYGAAMLAAFASRVIGIDIDLAIAKHALRTYGYLSNVQFCAGACEQIPLAGGTVDVVVSFETIEHHDKHVEMVREVKRVLAPEGIFILSSPNRLVYSDSSPQPNPFHVRELSFPELEALLRSEFAQVRFWGQRMAAGCFSYALGRSPTKAPTVVRSITIRGEAVVDGVAQLEAPVYLIAVCAGPTIDLDALNLDSLIADPEEDLYASLEAALRHHVEQGQQNEALLRALREQLEALRSDLTGRTEEADAMWADLARRTDETGALRKNLALRTDEVQALRSDLARRTEEAEGLRNDLALRVDEAETLRRSLASVTAENAQRGRELAATRHGVTDMQSMLAARSAEAARGEAELIDARQHIAELSEALEAQRLEANVMRTSTSWQITRPIRDVRQRYPRLADYGRRMLRRLKAGAGVDERGPDTDGHVGVRPGRDFDEDFLEPYFRSAGFSDPPAVTAGRLREAGWPVYGTRAAAEAVAAMIRGSELFDAEEYTAQRGDVIGIDPLLHYVIVGERMGLMPSKRFDPTYYRQRYPDVGQAQVNALAHYVTWGRGEGRRPLSVAAELNFDRSRIDPERETILLITHQASRTGAPIVTHNIARRLGRKYNVVAVLLTGGELVPHFDAVCAAVIGPLTYADWHPVEAAYLVKHLTTSYRVFMAIVNSIESRITLPALAYHLIPVVTLVHEFASYTRPEGTMGKALDWSTQVVFSAELVARAAQKEHTTLIGRPIHVLRQGRCDVPARWGANGPPVQSLDDLDRVFRPKGAEGALVVLGCGTVHLRKGVDLFLACAAAVTASRTRRPVRFVWIGHGYDPRSDVAYSCYLADQIARSGLEGSVQILDEMDDLEPAYRLSDVFFLSSRLDPLPNVTIDAALLGIPVVCFADATGIGEVLGVDPSTRRCVVPHLDVAGAAQVIAEFANDEEARREVGAMTRRLAEAAFDMDRYVDRIDQLGMEAVRIMRQRARDFDTIREDALFDERVSIPTDHPSVTRDEAIIGYLARWTAVNQSGYAATNELFRRPCAGFHPQVYAHECLAQYDAAAPNPLADFIRRGKPPGPWSAELIMPTPGRETSAAPPLRVGLHGHFFYPELATDFMRKVAANRWPCHLLLSTDSQDKVAMLREATVGYDRGEVLIRVVPNRGRDLGPLLTAYAAEVASQYDIIGHLHAKRSLLIADARLGESWREFLWQHLLGDRHPIMDIILDRFVTDENLGLVFAADPHLSDWDANLAMATDLADRIGIRGPLPPFFDFPIGTMFWARAAALKPLLELKLGWDDYPPEPVPYDGTILHALERLLPFAARREGYGYATTHIPGLTW